MHGFAFANDDALEVQLRLQAAILAAQRLGGQNIFQRDRGDARNRIQKVDVRVFTFVGRPGRGHV